MHKYRLTLLFAFTTLIAIAVAAIVVNTVIGRHAEGNLIRIAQDNTTREALHAEAMLRSPSNMSGDMAGASRGADTVGSAAMAAPLTMETILSSQDLLAMVPSLAVGLNVAKVSLLDLAGVAFWSTDPDSIGKPGGPAHMITWRGNNERAGKYTSGRR